MSQHALPGTGQPYLDIEKLKVGDVTSFHRLYQLFYGEFVMKATSMLDEKEEASALVNHCFIKCWLRSEALTSMNYILAFLNTTVRNNCLACNNSNGFRSLHYDNILRAVLSDSLQNGLTRKELFSTISVLPADQLSPVKPVFSRFYGRRMPVAEIARELGLLPDYVQQRLDLAFKMLHLILFRENI